MDALKELVDLLNVRTIEKNVFVGDCQDLGYKALFGGQVLGQSVVAAGRTVDGERLLHSLHGYFIRPGNSIDPVYFEVDLIRTGRSFSTRRVVAKQNGLAIFSMSCSFQEPEDGFQHQIEMPKVKGPDGVKSELERAREAKDLLPEKSREIFTRDRPIELREVDAQNPFDPKPRAGIKNNWIRAVGPLPDDPLIHAALLAYASDFGLATTSLLPHGVSLFKGNMQVASLDHAMWFHRPFRMDDWLLYHQESSSSSGARGFNQARIFTQDGSLVASVTQEGLMRKLTKPSAPSA